MKMTDNALLQSTKKDIRSLLLPNKDGLILKGLQAEHQAVLGCTIPSRKLGFYSDLEFLRSIPDVVEVINLPDKVNVLCKAVVDPNLDHIKQLVAKQKSNVRGYNTATKNVLDRQKFYQNDVGVRNHAFTTKSGAYSWEDHFQFMPNKQVYGSTTGNPSRGRSSRSNYNNRNAPTRRVNMNFKKDCLTITNNHPAGLDMAQFKAMYLKHTNKVINHMQFGFPTLEECLASIPDIVQIRHKEDETGQTQNTIFPSYYGKEYDETNTNIAKNSVPVMKLTRLISTSSESFQSFQQSEIGENCNHDTLQQEELETYTGVSEVNIHKTEQNLVKLMAMHPKGIELKRLGDVYSVEFGEELKPALFDCTSMDEMCIILNKIFKMERSTMYRNSWALFPRTNEGCIDVVTSKYLEQNKYSEDLLEIRNNISKLVQSNDVNTFTKGTLLEMYLNVFRKPLNLKTISMNMDELLNFLVDQGVIELSTEVEDPFKSTPHNQDVIISRKKSEIKEDNKSPDKAISMARINLKSVEDQFGSESIPVQKLPKDTMIDSQIEIIMGEIWNPTKFCILLKVYYEKLIELGREMTVFYGDRNTDHLMIQESHIVDGQVCAAREGTTEEGDWYRSVIVNILDTQTVTLQDIDYGQRRKVKLENIRFLRRDFAESLNAQAIPSKLSHVMPKNGNKIWSKNSSQYFAEIAAKSKDDGLFGVIKGLHHGLCGKLSLLLYDTSTNDFDDGININQELVNHGLADIDPKADQNEGYELMLSKELVQPIEEKSKKKPLPPLRLPALFGSNSNSSGYGTGPPQSPTSTVPTNAIKSWISSFMPFFQERIKEPNQAGIASKVFDNSAKSVSNVESKKRCNSAESSTSKEKNIVKKIYFSHDVVLHVIYIEDCRYVTSAEISALIPKWRKKDVLEQMLELKKFSVPRKVFTQEEHHNLFQELILEEVGGLTTPNGNLVKRIVVYPLEFIPQMLGIFGPRNDSQMEELIKTINSEMENSDLERVLI